MSKILNKIFDVDLYNTVKAERYELDQNGNKNMYNVEQLEGLAEQGNEEAKAIVDKVNNEVDEMLKRWIAVTIYLKHLMNISLKWQD